MHLKNLIHKSSGTLTELMSRTACTLKPNWLRESSAAKESLLLSVAMTGPGIMILLYGAGGEPGRGETPMRLRQHAAA